MININETMNKIDSLLAERGLTSEHKEQAVRQLLCHMMITGCRKERKKRGEKKKSPRTPLIKETRKDRKGNVRLCRRRQGGISSGVFKVYWPIRQAAGDRLLLLLERDIKARYDAIPATEILGYREAAEAMV